MSPRCSGADGADRLGRAFPSRPALAAHAGSVGGAGERADAAADAGGARRAPVSRVPRAVPDDAASCAAAPAADVVRLWAGLGYNRRALNLHRAAVSVVERHGGARPDDLDALLALPGVGPYTARAVLAFAFERDVGVLDVNAARVVHRTAGRRLSPREAQVRADDLGARGRGVGVEPGHARPGRHRVLRAPGATTAPSSRRADGQAWDLTRHRRQPPVDLRRLRPPGPGPPGGRIARGTGWPSARRPGGDRLARRPGPRPPRRRLAPGRRLACSPATSPTSLTKKTPKQKKPGRTVRTDRVPGTGSGQPTHARDHRGRLGAGRRRCGGCRPGRPPRPAPGPTAPRRSARPADAGARSRGADRPAQGDGGGHEHLVGGGPSRARNSASTPRCHPVSTPP